MVSRLELYTACRELLDEAKIPDSEFDALCIFQDMLGDRNPLFKPREAVSDTDEQRIRSLIMRRCHGEPLQYILGEWEFFGLPFKVGEGVLIPRPDTETLVEQVIDICRAEKLQSPKIADLCSGTGCIAIALKAQIPDAEVTAVELSEKALSYLEQNRTMNNADISVIHGDVLDRKLCESFSGYDIIVSNPPYLTAQEMAELQTEVRHEPESALYGGDDGLDFYREMTRLWKNSLRNGGFLAYEFGMGQHDAVGAILRENSFTDINFRKDGGGIIRTAAGKIDIH